MAVVTPIGNALYVKQAAPYVSQQVANAQNATQFQSALAAQLFSQKDHNKVLLVGQTDQDHEIDEKEKHAPEFMQWQKKHKKKDEEEPEEDSSSEHILDLKA
jgi:hypothetical protein